MNNIWYLYMIQTESGKIYTGITTNLEKRFNTHINKKGAKFFRTDAPKQIIHTETFENRSLATKREIEIKKMHRTQKLKLANLI